MKIFILTMIVGLIVIHLLLIGFLGYLIKSELKEDKQ